MARKTTTLSASEVQRAKPKIKEYTLSDGNNLGLRIKPSGTKSWIYNYYHPITKKRLNLSIGTYPAITLAKARTKAIEAQK